MLKLACVVTTFDFRILLMIMFASVHVDHPILLTAGPSALGQGNNQSCAPAVVANSGAYSNCSVMTQPAASHHNATAIVGEASNSQIYL